MEGVVEQAFLPVPYNANFSLRFFGVRRLDAALVSPLNTSQVRKGGLPPL
jgi:hypothetical protein